MRPDDLPPATSYEHGTRARYVCGCRCDACRASNVAAYHERQRRALAALGLTRYEIAAKLGSVAKTPALQLNRDRVLAMNAQKVARLHRAIVDEFRQRFEVRDELEAAGALGQEWFDGESYSVIRRGA